MKKVIAILLSFVMVFSLSVTAFAADTSSHYEFNSSNTELQAALENIDSQYIEAYNRLTFEQKDAKLREIIQAYTTPGEVLNAADSAFILLNRYEKEMMPQTRAGSSSQWYDVYKTQYNVRVNLYGTMRQDIAYIAGSSRFGGTATAWIQSGSVNRVDLEIFHTAFGLIGTSAPFVGVLYNGSVSMSKSGNNKTTKMDKEKDYGSILPVYTTMYAAATINTSTGDEFTVTSETWTAWH